MRHLTLHFAIAFSLWGSLSWAQVELPAPSTTSPPSEPPSLEVLWQNFNHAAEQQRWKDADQWLQQIIENHPYDPKTQQAQAQVKEGSELKLIEQAEALIAAGGEKEAIQLLVKIPKESLHRSRARQLIEKAESLIYIKVSIKNARERIRLEQWNTAEALLYKILQIDPEHEEANELMGRIQRQNTVHFLWDVLTWAVVLGGVGLFLVGGVRYRRSILSWLSLQEDATENPLKPPLRERVPPKEKKASQGDGLQERIFLETLEKVQSALERVKEEDLLQRYSSRVIDFEAEVAVIQKRAKMGAETYHSLTSKLLVILQTVRGFTFQDPQKQSYQKASTQDLGGKSKQQNTSQKKRENASKPQNGKSSKKTPNFYELLGVPKAATAKEIKKAYYHKLKEYHPDRHQHAEYDWIKTQAETMTRQLSEAYETLTNPQSRRQYDASI